MQATDHDLDSEVVRALLDYDPDSGVFRWKDRPKQPSFQRRLIGAVAGTPTDKGYRKIQIIGRAYLAHRLAWLLMTGKMPDVEVDHDNLDRADNRWKNLRLANHTQNMCNKGLRATNISGFKGVSYYKKTNKWKAQIQVEGKAQHLGYHTTREDAHAAYVAAAAHLHGAFARSA